MAILETARLTLRPFREDDVDRMAELFANSEFMRFSLGVFTKREQTVAFINKVIGWERAGMPSQFAVTPGRAGAIAGCDVTLLGYCGFYHHPDQGIADVEVGYRLDPACWNRGLATEAAHAVCEHAFRDWKLDRVISLVHPENFPSRRVAEKNGMVVDREITFRGFPTLMFVLTRDRWEKAHGAG